MELGEGEPFSALSWIFPWVFPSFPSLQYTNRCLLKWLKLWDTVVFGKDKAGKKPKPGPAAHPSLSHPKENPNKWKSKVQLTEEMLEAELDQHKRPKYKVSRRGRGPGVPLLPPAEEQRCPLLGGCLQG